MFRRIYELLMQLGSQLPEDYVWSNELRKEFEDITKQLSNPITVYEETSTYEIPIHSTLEGNELIKWNILQCLEGLTLKEIKQILKEFDKNLDNMASNTIIYPNT